MLWGERVGRRRVVVVVFIGLFVLIDVAFAVVAVQRDSTASAARLALPLHPIAGTFVPDDTRVASCSDTLCFAQSLGNIAYRDGPAAAFSLVARLYGDGADPNCHRVVHAIGAASLARFGNDVPLTFAKGSSICFSGYYHGVLERSLVNLKTRSADGLAPAARRLCAPARDMTPWIAFQCLHGLGHGLMIATGLDLPTALRVCRRLASWWDQDACRSGAFMENIQSSYGFTSRWLRDDDPVYPCNVVALDEKRRCYQMVTSRILPSVGDDWDATAERCSRVERQFRYMCFRSFGRDASSRSFRDVDKIAELCEKARQFGNEGACIYGAAQDVASNYMSGPKAAQLCDAVAGSLRATCYSGLGSVTGRFRKTERARQRDCSALTEDADLVDACMRGARSALPHSSRAPRDLATST